MVAIYFIYIIFSLSISIILIALNLYHPSLISRKTKIFLFGANCQNSNFFLLFAFTFVMGIEIFYIVSTCYVLFVCV